MVLFAPNVGLLVRFEPFSPFWTLSQQVRASFPFRMSFALSVEDVCSFIIPFALTTRTLSALRANSGRNLRVFCLYDRFCPQYEDAFSLLSPVLPNSRDAFQFYSDFWRKSGEGLRFRPSFAPKAGAVSWFRVTLGRERDEPGLWPLGRAAWRRRGLRRGGILYAPVSL